jgi:prepilin-type N-terminal cleavage/methylation domain-containing protein
MTIFEGREMKNGFTLIELLVTLAIAAILLTTAIPSFREIIRNNQLTTQANNLVTALHLARSEAVNGGQGWRFAPAPQRLAAQAGGTMDGSSLSTLMAAATMTRGRM